MSISTRLDHYLTEQSIPFKIIAHEHTSSSIATGIKANVPLHKIAKAVILKDHEDRTLMAILPAQNKISISAINQELLGSYLLAKEQMVYSMFSDCEHGAIPPIGAAFNMHMICDELLDELEHVYLESGDHQHLLRIHHNCFEKLSGKSKHFHFSYQAIH